MGWNGTYIYYFIFTAYIMENFTSYVLFLYSRLIHLDVVEWIIILRNIFTKNAVHSQVK